MDQLREQKWLHMCRQSIPGHFSPPKWPGYVSLLHGMRLPLRLPSIMAVKLVQQGTLVFTDLLPTQYAASTSDQVCLDSLPTSMDLTSTKLLSGRPYACM